MSTSFLCRHCHEPVEDFDGHDYVIRGKSWRHKVTGSVFCERTRAEPEPRIVNTPQRCPFCRAIEGVTSHAGGCQR